MSIMGIRNAIQKGLATISGLRAYDNVPDNPELPCAFPRPLDIRYHYTAGGNFIIHFEVVLLLRRGGNIQEKQEELDEYLLPTGTKSIPAAIEAAVLGTHAASALVATCRDYGGIEHPAGEICLGAKFDVEVVV